MVFQYCRCLTTLPYDQLSAQRLMYPYPLDLHKHLQNCLDAVLNGVSRVHIMDGRIAHCLLLEIFTNKGIGTAILKAGDDHFYTPDEK